MFTTLFSASRGNKLARFSRFTLWGKDSLLDNPQAPTILTTKLPSLRETSCQSCSLKTLCFPHSLDFQDTEQLSTIISHGQPLMKGEFLFRQSDKFTSLYVLRSGCIKGFSITAQGTEQITSFYLPGELIGLSGINTQTYPINAVAIETSTVCEVPYSEFERLSNKIPNLNRQLIHFLSREIHETLEMMQLLSQKSAEERVASFLLDLSLRIQLRGYAPDFIYLAMSRNEIANYLGLAVETVSRIFSKLHKLGSITASGRAVEITDSTLLKKSAGVCTSNQHLDTTVK